MGQFNEEYLGVVEKVDTDKCDGRCKVRIFGVNGHYDKSKDKIPTDYLPWALPKLHHQPASKKGSGTFSMPKVDSKVRVTFEMGDHNHPRYQFMEEIDPAVTSEAQNDPENFHSMFWDTDVDLKIYHTKGSGLVMDFKGSYVNIKPDNSIVINHKDSESTIELKGDTITMTTNKAIDQSATNTITSSAKKVHVNGEDTYVGHNPTYSQPMGEIVFQAISILAKGLDVKYPVTPGVYSGLIEGLKEAMLSKTVKVSH